MSDEQFSLKNWFDRLKHVLTPEPQDREHLIELIRDAAERQLLDNEAFKMIEGVLQVSEMHVRDVMLAKPQMVTITGNQSPANALPVITQSGHSRYPVIGESRDEILGILLAKDLLPFLITTTKPPMVRDLVRPATFIPESKRLDILLREFRLNRNHMAIVVDEYGTVSGLITIEDVLELIVGNIQDEYDIEESKETIKQLTDTSYLVNALTTIDDFNAYFGTEYDDSDFDTIGGLILQQFSHLPQPGETLKFDDFTVTVLQANRRGVQLLRFNKSEE